jgi:hypothetical protein
VCKGALWFEPFHSDERADKVRATSARHDLLDLAIAKLHKAELGLLRQHAWCVGRYVDKRRVTLVRCVEVAFVHNVADERVHALAIFLIGEKRSAVSKDRGLAIIVKSEQLQ